MELSEARGHQPLSPASAGETLRGALLPKASGIWPRTRRFSRRLERGRVSPGLPRGQRLGLNAPHLTKKTNEKEISSDPGKRRRQPLRRAAEEDPWVGQGEPGFLLPPPPGLLVWLPQHQRRPGWRPCPRCPGVPGGRAGLVCGSRSEVQHGGVGWLLQGACGGPNGSEGAWERAGGIKRRCTFDAL